MAVNGFRLPDYPIAKPNNYMIQQQSKPYDITNDARQKFWNYADWLQIDYKYIAEEFLQTPSLNPACKQIITDIFITKKVPDTIVSEDIMDKLAIIMLIYKGSREFPIQYHLYSLLRHLDYNNSGWGSYFRSGTNVPKTTPWLKNKYGGKNNKNCENKNTKGENKNNKKQ